MKYECPKCEAVYTTENEDHQADKRVEPAEAVDPDLVMHLCKHDRKWRRMRKAKNVDN